MRVGFFAREHDVIHDGAEPDDDATFIILVVIDIDDCAETDPVDAVSSTLRTVAPAAVGRVPGSGAPVQPALRRVGSSCGYRSVRLGSRRCRMRAVRWSRWSTIAAARRRPLIRRLVKRGGARRGCLDHVGRHG